MNQKHTLLSSFVAVTIAAASIQPMISAVRSARAEGNEWAAQVPAVAQPEALTQALGVTRAQSADTAAAAGGRVVVTYTVSNGNLPASAVPLSATATLTDKLAAMGAVDVLADANVLRNVLLVNTLQAGVTLESASLPVAQQGSRIALQLGDVAPSGSTQVTLALQVIATGADFVALDDGATAYASLRGRPLTQRAPVAQLAPDALAQYLIWTQDADTRDNVMLLQNSALGGDAATLFAFVRGLKHEVYAGSLRGTRGTLWGGAGNGLDKASLLIAMLRARGIPARYRHGTLDATRVQTLISSMFPASPPSFGIVPAGTPTADPLADATLQAEAGDHWWVEAHLPGTGWTDFDPSFASASAGQTFHSALSADDRVAELPDAQRHKITVWLEVEAYNVLSGLTRSAPLTHTFSAVQLSAQPLVLSHFVDGVNAAGLVFATNITTYSPYFVIGTDAEAEMILGSPYQDIASNFAGPASSQFHTGAWLNAAMRAPSGAVRSYQRPIADKIGVAARMHGGTIDVASTDGALFGPTDGIVSWFYANDIPQTAVDQAMGRFANGVAHTAQAFATLSALNPLSSRTPQQQADLQDAAFSVALGQAQGLAVLGLQFGAVSDQQRAGLSDAMRVRDYFVQPRMVSLATTTIYSGSAATGAASIDLRNMQTRALAYPGQNPRAVYEFNLLKGVLESMVEGNLLARIAIGPAISTAILFQEAGRLGIPATVFGADSLSRLASLGYSAVATARMTEAALNGKIVVVPARPIPMGDVTVAGWYEVDAVTGETIGVLENGLHGAWEYAKLLFTGSGPVAFLLAMNIGIWSNVIDKLLANLGVPISGSVVSIATELAALQSRVAVICTVELADGIDAEDLTCVAMFKAGIIAGGVIGEYAKNKGDPPVSSSEWSSVPAVEVRVAGVSRYTATATHAGTGISATLSTAHVAVAGNAGLYAPAQPGLGVAGAVTGTAFVNFAGAGQASLNDGALMAAPASGVFGVGAGVIGADHGVAVLNFSGQVAVTESAAALDTLTLRGGGEVFAVRLTPAAAAINPTQQSVFAAGINSNASRSYTLSVHAPAGWDVQINSSGQITATPPAGAAAGDYALWVSAQAEDAPRVFASAEHIISVQPYLGMQAVLTLDTLTTVPWGAPRATTADETNNGQVQMQNAAYALRVTNTSQTAQVFDVTLSGLPTGWALLAANPGATTATLSLGAGAFGDIGIYISPTSGIPAAGSAYPFNVSVGARGVPTLSVSISETFVVAALPYAFHTLTPAVLYATSGEASTLHLLLENVGNASGTFALTPTLPTSTWSVNAPASVSVAAGARITQALTLTPTGQAGDTQVFVLSTHSAAYTLTAATLVKLTTPQAGCIYRAHDALAIVPGAPAGALAALASTTALLEAAPSDAAKRTSVVTALNTLIVSLGEVGALPALAQLQAVADALSAHSDAADVLNDLAALCSAISNASAQTGIALAHAYAAGFTPGSSVSLAGRAAETVFALTNRGTLSSSVSVTLTSPALGAPVLLAATLAPGANLTHSVMVSAASAGFVPVYAAVNVATGAAALPNLQDSAIAGVNFVSPALQVLDVIASPAFVDFGSSSTQIVARVANATQWRSTAVVTLSVLAPSGAVSATQVQALVLPAGTSNTASFGSLNTSGFQTGTYTLTVRAVLSTPVGLAGAASTQFGFLSVGQGLFAGAAITPVIVAPGTVTVTTVISTFVDASAPIAQARGLPQAARAPLSPAQASLALAEVEVADISAIGSRRALYALQGREGEVEQALTAHASFAGGIMRTETTATLFAVTGTWGSVNSAALASGDSYSRSNVVSSSLSFTFTGSWVNLGYLADDSGRHMEVFIDGVSQGVIDTYGNVNDAPRSRAYGGLVSATHVISVLVLSTKNAFAGSNAYARIDYVDTWDGSLLSDGVFEHDSPRVILGDAWSTITNSLAGGGTFARSGLGTGSGAAWFAFTGDSVSYRMVKDFNNAGEISVYVDGVWRADVDLVSLFGASDISTPTLSFDGLGSGPHVMMLLARRGFYSSLDQFITPGVAPFYTPAVRSGVHRHEENDPAVLLNGVPFLATRTSWNEGAYSIASDGYIAHSSGVSDTVSMVFTGSWAALGYVARLNAGRVEVFIDGSSRGVIDTYSALDTARTAVYADLGAGVHTLSVTVLGTRNPFANLPGDFYFDYIEAWDGTALADGTFAEDSARLLYGSGWSTVTQSLADGGAFARSPLGSGTVWFHFTGDSVAVKDVEGFANASEVGIWIDGHWREWHDLYATAVGSETLSFNGLGAGPHVLMLALHRGFFISLDGFATPAAAPHPGLLRSGMYRFEEDDPALRYNGAPFTQTTSSWDYATTATGSDYYMVRGRNPSETVALTFDGAWVALGFVARSDGRMAEIFLDGVSQGVIDTYSPTDDVLTRVYSGLLSGTHTISFSVSTSVNVSATGGFQYVNLDYIDVWDGTPAPSGFFQHLPVAQDGGRMYRSRDWDTVTRGSTLSGTFIEDGSNSWFLFTGPTVTVIAVTDALTPSLAEVFIDGISQGVLDLSYPFGRSPVPYTFGGLADTAHQVRVVDRSGAGSNRGAGLEGFDTRSTPFAGLPMVEWAVNGGETSENFDVTSAVGDLNGDGMPEIVSTTSAETCFFTLCTFTNKAIYAFDGATGGLVFSRSITGTAASCTGGNLCGGIGSPAIINLDGGSDIEIIVDSSSGLRAYKNDGTLLWWNQTVLGTWASAVAVGNLDADDAPEIVAVHDGYAPVQKRVHIVQADGSTSWTYTLPTTSPGPRMPTLADFNGDGRLDLALASGQTLYLFHNNGVSMTLAYTHSIGLSHYGAPAVADIDDDGLPEILIGWTGVLMAYEHDLAPKWIYTTGGQYPSTISVADLDGNDGGAPEIVIYSKTSGPDEEGRVFALNHDGSLLWSQPTRDETNSSAGVAVLDLDGNGVWEVVWNGSVSGTLIMDGPTGAIQFADETINSGTINETPVIADVDDDGRAEIVLVNGNQLVVLGYDQAWAGARPLWNQHSYHISNVNDDLTVAPFEPNSWDSHNTYRTQSPLAAPAPVYNIAVTHTMASGASALTPTFGISVTDANPTYAWSYRHYWYERARSVSFDALLSNVQPGEVRKVSEGTWVSYTVGAGSNRLQLPPLYVTGAHILGGTPLSQTTGRGSSAGFTLVLSNPAAAADVYTLSLAGLNTRFTAVLPVTMNVPANSAISLALEVHVPEDAATGAHEFVIAARNTAGGGEALPLSVNVDDALAVQWAPQDASVTTGDQVTLALRIGNAAASARVLVLGIGGLDGMQAGHVSTVSVPAATVLTTTVVISSAGPARDLLLTARVTDTLTAQGAADDALLHVLGTRAVAAAFAPPTATIGLRGETLMRVQVSNTGSLNDSYDLVLSGPFESMTFARSDAITEVQALPAHVMNGVPLQVHVAQPSGGLAPGLYPISLTARSRTDASVMAVAVGQVQVLAESVAASLSPALQTAAPGSLTAWQLWVTNTGSVAATYALTGLGGLAGQTQVGALAITLSPGASGQVPVTVAVPALQLAGLLPIAVQVQSQSAPDVSAVAGAMLNVTSTAAAQLLLSPATIVISDANGVQYGVRLTNTGNSVLEFQLQVSSTASVTLAQTFVTLPAGSGGLVLLDASAAGPANHPITVRAVAGAVDLAASGALIWQEDATPTPTATATSTPTSTPTATSTSTNTSTATSTPTPTSTSTSTATSTPTPTSTSMVPETVTPTPTRVVTSTHRSFLPGVMR